jgi:hypothetical protein
MKDMRVPAQPACFHAAKACGLHRPASAMTIVFASPLLLSLSKSTCVVYVCHPLFLSSRSVSAAASDAQPTTPVIPAPNSVAPVSLV